MAYPAGDSYGSPPYPQSNYDNFPDPRRYQSPNVNTPYQPDGARRYENQAPVEHPIYNAVNNAFDKSAAANALPDEVRATHTSLEVLMEG